MRKLLCFMFVLGLMLSVSIPAFAAKKAGTVTFDVTLNVGKDSKTASLYLPYPMSDQYQTIRDMRISGTFDSQGVYTDPKTNAVFLYAKWNSLAKAPKLTMSFHVDSHFVKGGELKDGGSVIPADVKKYLKENDFLPVNHPEVKRCAKEATEKQKTILGKARAVYDWTIANTYRDPDVRGCGLGDAIKTLTEAHGGGKCADISSVFITVARAAGIPARDVYGLRFPGKDGAITGDYHCWTEFYLPGHGWVMADPADVRKAMLVEKLQLGDAKTKEYIKFFWNGDDLFRIALHRAEHGVRLPDMKGDPVGYFMYPYAEVDGKALDFLAPATFSYTVSFKAD